MNNEIKQDGDNFIYSYTHKIMTQIVDMENKEAVKVIEKFCEENGYIPNLIDKDKLESILKLGINAYQTRQLCDEGIYMNNDIKEMIENLKEDVEQNILIEVRGNVFKPLLDYIIDLQEEMEKLRSAYIGERLKNDKAIEYIKEHTLYSFDLYDKDDVSSYFEKASPKDLLNILQGDDESENKSNE